MKPDEFVTNKPTLRSQRGIGMIEVLISLLILSIGLLGMAALQARGLTMTTESLQRTQATILANDIIERARANRVNVAGYDTNGFLNPAPSCDLTFFVANASVVADDLAEWENNLGCLLAGGNGRVDVNGNNLTVTITWQDRTEIDEADNVAIIEDRDRLTVRAGI
ncbi:MAG: type IV pilus modification protein PilV [Saccharospirillum sp.]|nr:type IV pilus modification protein PilV [Saccharospirillum sp.]